MHELLIRLLAGAVIKARRDIYKEYGVFMPPEQFTLVELCDQVLHATGYHPDV